MNLLDTCEAQLDAVGEWFDELADAHHLLPTANLSTNEHSPESADIETQA